MQAGDVGEITSLQSVFGISRAAEDPREDPLVISSIKGNIGHSEAASGSAGLAKLLLMLRHKTIPMQASLSQLNPHLANILTDGIVIPRRAQAWTSSQPRRALLNNFGAAGSNAALLLEERINPSAQGDQVRDRAAYPFNISARSAEAVQQLVQEYHRVVLADKEQTSFRNICYTATARRQLYEYRISLTCSSADELCQKLVSVDFNGAKLKNSAGPLVFVFSGQGSTYVGMATELIETSPVFRDTVIECDALLKDLDFHDTFRLLQTMDDESLSMSDEDHVVGLQCACVVFEYALAKLWMSWNVVPDIVVGHR